MLLGGIAFSQGLVVTIKLTTVDISIIKLNPHLCKQPNDSYVAFPSTSMQDMAGNAVIPQLEGMLHVTIATCCVRVCRLILSLWITLIQTAS